jgi:hypothetical protein
MRKTVSAGVFHKTAWAAFFMSAALLPAPARAEPLPEGGARSAAKPAIRLKIIQPKPGTTWYFSSKQVIEWSVSGLPAGEYAVVAYLKGVRDGKKGMLMEDSAGNGRAQANYVVNEIGYGDADASLRNGKYAFSLALYDKSGTGGKGPGKLVLEKKGGIVAIKGSDAGMGPDSGPRPDSGNGG